MESRFSRLRQRDTSVSMLRVKMSRRKSQSQKENRERMVNNRRQLDKLPELEISSLNASIATVNMSTLHEKTKNDAKSAKALAQEERLKRLERWKQQKALEKEKEKREKGHTGVFKTGVYQPKDKLSFTTLPPTSSRPKEKMVTSAPSQSSRITRSMKQQQLQEAQKPLAVKHPNTTENKERSTRTRAASVKPAPAAAAKTKVCAGYPAVPGAVRALSTRSAHRTLVTKASVVKDNPKPIVTDVRTTRSKVAVTPLPPSSGQVENCKAVRNTPCLATPNDLHEIQEPEKTPCPGEENKMIVVQDPEESVLAVRPSFAPEGFVFQAPAGLSSFQFEPLTPRSADAFLTPSSSFNLPSAPALTVEPQSDPSEAAPPKTPQHFPPRTSPAPPTPGSPTESKRDVPYFRSEIANETDRLTSLCLHWDPKVEDESIPEEMRNRMRTAVGQARLLMKERFSQFSGLVDDCELGRGEKITTCMDLQGFWDMVYFQVEDVNKKFDALKEAEGRGWVEEDKPPPRQKKVIKKPPAAAATKPTGSKAAAKSRLAAVKAAMRAKQQAAEAVKAATDAANTESPKSQEQQPQTQETVVFDGGFFQVESPIKPSIRRSSRLGAVVTPQASLCPLFSPRRLSRRSLALARAPVCAHASPAQPVLSPAQDTPQACQNRPNTINASLHFSPVKEVLSDGAQSEQNPTQQSESLSMQEDVAELGTPLHDSVETEDNTPADAPKLSLPLCKTPPPVLHTTPSSLSFTLSPCGTPDQTLTSSAAVVQQSVCHTPDGSTTEEIPGLGFERYLQPSQRCSMTPMDTVAVEMSPMEADVEMASPRGQPEDVLMEQEPAQSAASLVFSFPSPQVRTTESNLLLFTPDPLDRIRESVCPSDLMVFTPPSI